MAVVFTIKITTTELSTPKRSDSITASPFGRVSRVSHEEDYRIFRNSAVVRDALQTVVEAQGGVLKLAKQTDMDPQVLSKVLSNDDTPLIDALGAVLSALGYQLSIKPLESESPNLETDADELRGQTAHVAESSTSLQ